MNEHFSPIQHTQPINIDDELPTAEMRRIARINLAANISMFATGNGFRQFRRERKKFSPEFLLTGLAHDFRREKYPRHDWLASASHFKWCEHPVAIVLHLAPEQIDRVRRIIEAQFAGLIFNVAPIGCRRSWLWPKQTVPVALTRADEERWGDRPLWWPRDDDMIKEFMARHDEWSREAHYQYMSRYDPRWNGALVRAAA